MSVTAQDFMASARDIAKSGLDEMSQRNAISRAYYSAFHTTKSAIPPDGKARGPIGMHKNYIKQLAEAANGSPERRVGIRLAALYRRRVDADYNLDLHIPKGDFALQVTQVAELLEILDAPEEKKPVGRPQLKCVK